MYVYLMWTGRKALLLPRLACFLFSRVERRYIGKLEEEEQERGSGRRRNRRRRRRVGGLKRVGRRTWPNAATYGKWQPDGLEIKHVNFRRSFPEMIIINPNEWTIKYVQSGQERLWRTSNFRAAEGSTPTCPDTITFNLALERAQYLPAMRVSNTRRGINIEMKHHSPAMKA